MSTGIVVVCWILALPAVAAFYLAYGVVEEIIPKTASDSYHYCIGNTHF